MFPTEAPFLETDDLIATGQLEMQLAADREKLRLARLDLKVCRARAEMDAIEAAGGTKRFGDSAEVRERKLILVVADDLGCQQQEAIVNALEQSVALNEARFSRATRAIRYWEWHVRSRLTDTLDRLAGRPCLTNLEHQLHTLLAEATGEKGVYAGESDWVETHRVG